MAAPRATAAPRQAAAPAPRPRPAGEHHRRAARRTPRTHVRARAAHAPHGADGSKASILLSAHPMLLKIPEGKGHVTTRHADTTRPHCIPGPPTFRKSAWTPFAIPKDPNKGRFCTDLPRARACQTPSAQPLQGMLLRRARQRPGAHETGPPERAEGELVGREAASQQILELAARRHRRRLLQHQAEHAPALACGVDVGPGGTGRRECAPRGSQWW